jgi:antitoxin YefM
MQTITYTDFSKNPASFMHKVNEEHTSLRLTLDDGTTVLLVSEEVQAHDETAYLLSNPANAAHLKEAIAQLNAGLGKVHSLFEDEDDA